jgi:hypothetical protein
MAMRFTCSLAAAASLVVLAACATVPRAASTAGHARFGETVKIGPMLVQPVALIEDSRCPAGVQCVWAGRLRITAKVDGSPRQLTLGEKSAELQGPLTLVEATPTPAKDAPVAPAQYLFGFAASAPQ